MMESITKHCLSFCYVLLSVLLENKKNFKNIKNS